MDCDAKRRPRVREAHEQIGWGSRGALGPAGGENFQATVEHGYKELVRAKQKVPYIRVFLISVVQCFPYQNVFNFFASFRDVF